MSDRFDLESNIMQAWNTSEDIDALFSHMGTHPMSEDELMNSLIGIKSLHDIRMQKLWDCFEHMIKETKIT